MSHQMHLCITQLLYIYKKMEVFVDGLDIIQIINIIGTILVRIIIQINIINFVIMIILPIFLIHQFQLYVLKRNLFMHIM